MVPPSFTNRIALNYNFNGVVHTGEEEDPDNPDGYRSISDRGLNWQGGTPTATNGAFGEYLFVEQALVPDIVHVGDRDQRWPFDPTPDGDDRGIQPNWLPNPDQRGPQTTQLADLIRMDASSAASVLIMISDGGGSGRRVQLHRRQHLRGHHRRGRLVRRPHWARTASTAADAWRGGAQHRRAHDRPERPSGQDPAPSTSRTRRTATRATRFAMNVIGCRASGALAQVNNLGGGTGPSISTSSNGRSAATSINVSGGPANAPGVWLIGAGVTSVPVSLIVPGCGGTVATPSPILFNAALDANGESTFTLSFPVSRTRRSVASRSRRSTARSRAACPSLSDALAITVGN